MTDNETANMNVANTCPFCHQSYGTAGEWGHTVCPARPNRRIVPVSDEEAFAAGWRKVEPPMLWIVAEPFGGGGTDHGFIAGPFTMRSEAERCVTTLAAQSLWRTIKITTSEP